MRVWLLFTVFLALCLNINLALAAPDFKQRPEVQQFIAEQTDNYSEQWLSELFEVMEYQQSALDLFTRVPEQQLSQRQYNPIFIEPIRINRGLNFYQQNKAWFDQAYEEYGVEPDVILAIIAMETNFGSFVGRHPTFDTLATLAFDHPSRSDFFRRELVALLQIMHEQQLSPELLVGSYAGAMGLPQFMPSSYLAYAVDHDKDGVVDIWTSPADAIGSVANYLAVHGWQANLPQIISAQVSGDYASILRRSTVPSVDIAEARSTGWEFSTNLPDSTMVSPLQMDAEDGYEYWLGTANMRAVARYNPSLRYAMTVALMSEIFAERIQ